MTQKLKSRHEDLTERSDRKTPKWETKNKQPITAKKVIEGRTLNYVTITEIDSATELAKYNPDMFRIENIADIEAAGQLTENQLTASTLMMIDYNEQGAGVELDKMEAEEWAKNYVKSYKNKETKQ